MFLPHIGALVTSKHNYDNRQYVVSGFTIVDNRIMLSVEVGNDLIQKTCVTRKYLFDNYNVENI